MRSPQEYIGENLETFKSEILEFLRIPSISTSPDHLEEVQEAASWLKDMIEQSGLQAEIHQTPGHPIVLGEWREAGNNAPTVLVYGHYDVQPVEPLSDSEILSDSLRNSFQISPAETLLTWHKTDTGGPRLRGAYLRHSLTSTVFYGNGTACLKSFSERL